MKTVRYKEMVGERFGRLVVLEKEAYPYWRCKCDCGAESRVSRTALISGHSLSCGCLKEDIWRKVAKSEDMVGKKFGALTVLYRADSEKGGVYWACRCDCGNLHVARGNAIRHGHTKSCGCMRGKPLIHGGEKASVKVGEVYGLLTVLEKVAQNDQGSRWLCACQCGETTEARGKDLRNGNTASCGCAKRNVRHLNGGIYRKIASEVRP